MSNKFEIKIPMLSLSGSASKGSPEMKDKDGKVPREKKKRKEIDKAQPIAVEHGMTAGMYKPPSKKEMAHDTVHSAMRESMRKWISGEISTKDHKENMRRGMNALDAIPKIREGKY